MQLKWLDSFEPGQLAGLFNLYKNQWWTQDRSFDEFVIMLDNSTVTLACYSHDNLLLAFSRVLSDGVFKAIIFDLIVHTDFQGQGIGQIMVDKIITYPDLAKVKSFELYCPESITGFYLKQGFSRCNSAFLEKIIHPA